MRVMVEEYIEDTPSAVVGWLVDEVDAMRHPKADKGEFLAGYLAAQEQVKDMLGRLDTAMQEIE